MTKTVHIQEMIDFAKDSGYLIATFKKQSNNYVKIDDIYPTDLLDDRDVDNMIIVSMFGYGLDFKEVTTEDKRYCFRLHNNFNVPKIIPIIQPILEKV